MGVLAYLFRFRTREETDARMVTTAGSMPVMSYRRLVKALRRQGFRLVPTTDGYRVEAPSGIGSSALHKSVDKDQTAYRNSMAQLIRIGFVHPAEYERRRREERREQALQQQARVGETLVSAPPEQKEEVLASPAEVAPWPDDSDDDSVYWCHAPVCTAGSDGQRYWSTTKQGRSMHEYRAHGERFSLDTRPKAVKDRESRVRRLQQQREEKAPPKQRIKKAGPVRVRHQKPGDPAVEAQQLVENLQATMTQLVELVGASLAENQELRRYRDRAHKVLGDLIDLG
jgi:hypothetical protein